MEIVKLNSDTLHHFNRIHELLLRGIFVEGISILRLNIIYLELVSLSFAIWIKGPFQYRAYYRI